MSCQEHLENYELYAMGLLEAGEARTDLEAHLARRCPNCVKGVREASEAFSMVALSARMAQPPPELRERILAAARRERKTNVVAMPAAQAKALWQTALPWAMAAGLLVGLGYYRQAEQARTEELVSVRVAMQHLENARKLDQTELDRLRPLGEFLKQAETRMVTFGEPAKTPPRGRVLVNPGQGVLLLAGSLPALPEGRTFQMWLLPKTGGPQPAGLFLATEGAAVHVRTGAVDLAQTTAIAVSVEPQGGSPAPTTTPIIVAPLGGL